MTTKQAGEVAAVMVPVAALRPWVKNPRKNDPAVEKVAASIKRFGFGAPIVARREDGEVIAGHTRLKAAILLKLAAVPVRYLDLTPSEARAYALADNKLGEIAEWDTVALVDVVREMAQDATPLEGLGWSPDDIDKMLGRAAAGGSGLGPHLVDPDDDDVPPAPNTPDSKPGEVYHLGPHRLVCGDSTKGDTWDRILDGAKVQMVWTDPPYGVAVNAVSSVEEAKRLHRRTDGKVVLNDSLTPDQLLTFLRASLGAIFKRCQDGAVWYVAAPAGPLHNIFGTVLIELDVWRRSVMWLKDRFAFGRGDYHYRHEPIFYGWKPGAAHYFCDDRTQDTVHEFPRPSRSEEHPTMKPVDLVRRHIRNSSKPGWLIGEPFGGSGTTLLAAAAEGRVARLIELDPGYCDVIRRRWTRYAKANNLDAGPGALDG